MYSSTEYWLTLPQARWIIGDTLRTNEAETGSMRVNREP
jgi:hypothetical protein